MELKFRYPPLPASKFSYSFLNAMGMLKPIFKMLG